MSGYTQISESTTVELTTRNTQQPENQSAQPSASQSTSRNLWLYTAYVVSAALVILGATYMGIEVKNGNSAIDDLKETTIPSVGETCYNFFMNNVTDFCKTHISTVNEICGAACENYEKYTRYVYGAAFGLAAGLAGGIGIRFFGSCSKPDTTVSKEAVTTYGTVGTVNSDVLVPANRM